MTVNLEKKAKLLVKECKNGRVFFSLSRSEAEACLHPGICVLSRLFVMCKKNSARREALCCIGPKLLQGAQHFIILLLKIELLHELLELGQNSL